MDHPNIKPEKGASTAYGYGIALCSAVVLSTTAIFIRHLTVQYRLPVLVLAFWRDVFVVAVLAALFGLLARGRFRIRKSDGPFLAVYGLVLAGFNAALTTSVAENGAAVSTVLVYSSAVFTVGLGWRFLREKIHGGMLLAVALCFFGCALVSGWPGIAGWRFGLAGLGSGLLSGLGYAGYTVMGRQAALRGISPWTSLFYVFGFAAAFLFLINLIPGALLPGAAGGVPGLFWLGSEWPGWAVLFFLAAGPTVAGFGLYNLSLTRLPAGTVNLIVTIEPVFTLLAAYLVLGEELTLYQGIGTGMILMGVILLRVREETDGLRRQPAGDRMPVSTNSPRMLRCGEMASLIRAGWEGFLVWTQPRFLRYLHNHWIPEKEMIPAERPSTWPIGDQWWRWK